MTMADKSTTPSRAARHNRSDVGRAATMLLRFRDLTLLAAIALLMFNPAATMAVADAQTIALTLLGATSAGLIAMHHRNSELSKAAAVRLGLYAATFAVLLPIYGIAVYSLRHGHGPSTGSVPIRSLATMLVMALTAATGGGRAALERALRWSTVALGTLTVLSPLPGLAVGRQRIQEFGSFTGAFHYSDRSLLGLHSMWVCFSAWPIAIVGSCLMVPRLRRSPSWRGMALLGLGLAPLLLPVTYVGLATAAMLIAFALDRVSRVASIAFVIVSVALFVAPTIEWVHLSTAQLRRSYPYETNLLFSFRDGFRQPSRAIAGDGVGACIQTVTGAGCVPWTQFSYLDLVRVFGAVGAVMYACLLAMPAVALPRRRPEVWLGYCLVLVAATTNATILSPLGAVVIALGAVSAYSVDLPASRDRRLGHSPSRGIVRRARPVNEI